MKNNQQLITIIIPSSCIAARADSLRHAIASAHDSAPGIVNVVVAANGPNVAPEIAAELQNRTDVRYLYFTEGSAPSAIASTLPLIDTEYFGFLDDDDELLPGGLLSRLETLLSQPRADLVISNGYLRKSGQDSVFLHRLKEVPAAPLEAFFIENWLPSCGGLFRLDRIEINYFQDYHPYAEWSWLAFRLALDKKQICVLDKPTFRVCADTPSSLSKSSRYREIYLSLHQKMLGMTPPNNIRKILKERLSKTHHNISSNMLSTGNIRGAIIHHIYSLCSIYGWRYFAYTRHIAAALLNRNHQ